MGIAYQKLKVHNVMGTEKNYGGQSPSWQFLRNSMSCRVPY